MPRKQNTNISESNVIHSKYMIHLKEDKNNQLFHKYKKNII